MEESVAPAPSPQEVPPPPLPPPRRFFRPLLFWLFLFMMPACIVFETLAIYVHEFSHGLTALALGGYFLGIKIQRYSRRTSTMAYADAWCEGHQNLVLIAGILVNVGVGLIVLQQAFGCKKVVPRLLLFLCAEVFLGDVAYALQGCLYGDTDFDTAMILQDIGSAGLRWICAAVLMVAFSVVVGVLSRGLFRAWEQVFGALSGPKAFWVVFLLVVPIPTPIVRDWPVWAASLAAFVVVTAWLIRTRQRTLDPAQLGRFRPWGLGLAGSFVVAAAAAAAMVKGIRLGTYPDRFAYDLHPERNSAAGFSARYGMGNRYGENRPVYDPKLFVSTPQSVRTAPSPMRKVIDLTWLPDSDRILVVGSGGLHEVEVGSGKSSAIWMPPWGWITNCHHGPRGRILALVREGSDEFELRTGLYVYDGPTSAGQFREASGTLGNPVFLPTVPVSAQVSIGEDLWEVTWPERVDQEIVVNRQKGRSKEAGWFEGASGDSWWWYDGEAWKSGETRILNQEVTRWGAGSEGFFILKGKDGWERITPAGDRSCRGTLDMSSVTLLQFLNGTPWVALRNGDIRSLVSDKGSFRILLP